MTLTFYRYGSTDTTGTLELDETKSSIIDKLNEPTRLSAILTSETAPQIALGNYTTYKGTRYYVTKEPTVRKEHSQLYTVEVDLERSIGLGRITILANPVDHRTTFDYTGTATEHLQLIIDCLNAKYEEVELKWTRGAVHCKDTIKHIKYDGATVLGALQQIRETYETDIFADGETLSLGQEDDKTTALPLAYGKGKGLLSGLERHKHTDDTVPTRLYVTGTKRNMTKGRLTLEKDVILSVDLKSGAIERVTGGVPTAGGRSYYRTDPTGQYIAEWSSTDKFFQSSRRFPTEATYTNEEIYPSHVSTIKSVTKVKDHYEVNSDFNYDKFHIEGEQMQVVFQTGNLAGRDFDAKYYPSTGRLAIVPKEEDDTTLPSDILCPKVGDQYIVTGIKLPDEYIREAERNLTDEALRHLVKLQETRYSYKADIDPVYLHDNHNTIAPQLAVGRYVRLTDPQIAIGDPYVRIVGKRTYLDRPYTPEIELSNEIEPRSELTRVLNDLDRQDEGLASILERLRQSGLVLSDLTLSSNAMRQRVEAAEEALAGKQPKGSYALTSELATSQQQAVAEAVKRAGEMDKQIKVGGRNLIRNSDKSLSNSDYYVVRYEISDPSLMVAGEDYTIQIWGEIEGADYSESIWVYNSGGNTEVANIQKIVNGVWQMTFKWRDDGDKLNRYLNLFRGANHPNNKNSYNTTIIRIKLERGTVATDWTPAPEDLDNSISKLNKSLTSLASTLLDPDQGEIHKLTSQLATSQQQAVAEAVRQAGEMDKKLKVGGRNLIVTSRWKAGYLYGDREENAYPVGSENYKVLVGYDTFRFDPVYIPTLGESKVTYKLYDNGGSTNGTVQIHAYDKDKKFLWWSVDGWNGTIGHTNAWTLPTDTAYIRLGVTNENVRAKVEFGTVATDWTPAPEDVAESVSKVSKSLEELSDHPLTVDKNGFWKIWSVKDGAYKTTQYQSRGEDAGRYLGRAKRIHPDFNGNYLLETEDSWRTAKEGDYVYLVGDAPNRGGDKDTYYIVREHKSKTVWEVYSIKGHTPKLTLDEQLRLLADGELLSQQSLRGEAGHTPHIDWDGTKLVIDNMAPVDLRGEAGHSPSAEEVLKTKRFKTLLGGEVTSKINPVAQEVTSLQDVALTPTMREDLDYLTESLKVLRNSDGSFQDVALQRYIALSGNGKDISAYLASNTLPAVLKAGITDFGQPTEREQVAIRHNGTGHIGNLYFEGNQIDFRTSRDTDPYLSIGAEESQFIDQFIATARVDQQVVYASSVTLTTSTTSYERTVDVANDGTRLTVTIDSIKIETYGSAKTRLTLDGEVLAEWRGKEYKNHGGSLTGGDIEITQEPYTASDLSYERAVKAGRHTIRLDITNPTDGATATVKGLRVRRRYDTGRQQSALTKSGLRLFGSPDRYLDVDYRRQYYNPPSAGGYVGWISNPYLVRIKGGAKVDKLTADELDMPGVPLCGATFEASGSSINSFGAKAKQQGASVAQAYRAYNADFYRVYHSIGHKNYIPVLQVYGLSNGNYTQCLTTRIDAIEADSFAVRIVTTGNVSVKHSFSYVAFKTTE